MANLQTITDALWRWIDSVATTLVTSAERLNSRRRIQLIEGDDGTFTFRSADGADGRAGRRLKIVNRETRKRSQAAPFSTRIVDGSLAGPLPAEWGTALRGGRVDILLRPKRFLLQPLELPRQAQDFLAGIIRAQIDRLTPWSASDAVFGWTPPADKGPDRIQLSIVATARSVVMPFVSALANLGASAITVSTFVDAAPVAVLTQSAAARPIELRRVRRILVAGILMLGMAALASLTAGAFVADSLDAELQRLQHKITARRTAMRHGETTAGSSAERELAQRKQTTPASVLVLEELSRILPDHTYVTELRIEGDKLQLIGITHDAPSLIELIEQSSHFTRATFFAPTTQTTGDPDERFHIEARIRPQFGNGT
jgi:general secretion pathway protein L